MIRPRKEKKQKYLPFTIKASRQLSKYYILGKGSLQEVEIGAVVPVCKLHAEKEPRHTSILCQIQPEQVRRPTIWGYSSAKSVSEK